MGKIRIKTLGVEEIEKQQQKDAEKRRQIKKEKTEREKGEGVGAGADVEHKETVGVSKGMKDAKEGTAKGLKGGDREEKEIDMSKKTGKHVEDEGGAEKVSVVSEEVVGDVEDEVKAEKKVSKKSEKKEKDKTKKKDTVSSAGKTHVRGKKYVKARQLAKMGTSYKLSEAVKLVKNMAYASFDETVEIHMNVLSQGLKGEVQLPYGTGREVKVAVADDSVIKNLEKGVIDFDILIATPAMMPKLVPFAKVLGPKGLMPNPKNGTIVDDTAKAEKKFKGGGVRFKGESKFPLLHQAVGKISFSEKNLCENIVSLVNAVQKKNIIDVYISSTMSPSVKINLETI